MPRRGRWPLNPDRTDHEEDRPLLALVAWPCRIPVTPVLAGADPAAKRQQQGAGHDRSEYVEWHHLDRKRLFLVTGLEWRPAGFARAPQSRCRDRDRGGSAAWTARWFEYAGWCLRPAHPPRRGPGREATSRRSRRRSASGPAGGARASWCGNLGADMRIVVRRPRHAERDRPASYYRDELGKDQVRRDRAGDRPGDRGADRQRVASPSASRAYKSGIRSLLGTEHPGRCSGNRAPEHFSIATTGRSGRRRDVARSRSPASATPAETPAAAAVDERACSNSRAPMPRRSTGCASPLRCTGFAQRAAVEQVEESGNRDHRGHRHGLPSASATECAAPWYCTACTPTETPEPRRRS